MSPPSLPTGDNSTTAPTGLAGRDIAAAGSASVLSALPFFLVAALAEQIRATLDFDVTTLGTLFSFYYLTAALASIPMSRAVEIIGPLRAMRYGAVATAVLLILLAGLVNSYASLVVFMVLIGPVSAAMQPATNLFLIRRTPSNRRGLAFGLKQAAVPTAVALAGLAVPTVGLTIGWRWAFVIVGSFALGAALIMPRSTVSLSSYRAREPTPRLSRREIAQLSVMSVGFALSVSAAAALSSFAVTALVAAGLGYGNAGLFAAIGGVIAGISRISVGLGADHSHRPHIATVIVMLIIATGAYLLVAFATATVPALLLPALGIAFAAGWGWNGLFSLAIATSYPDKAARATGLTSVGGRGGGVLGPFVFGLVATHGGYPSAWIVAAGAALVGAIIIGLSRYL